MPILLERYLLDDKLLDDAGHSTVRMCRHRHTGHDFAARVIPKPLPTPAHLLTLRRQAAQLQLLRSSPVINAVEEVLESDTALYLITPLEHGIDVGDNLCGRPVDEPMARCYLGQVVHALVECYAIGVAHGGIRPESVVVDTKTGGIRLLDLAPRCLDYFDGRRSGRWAAPEELADETWQTAPEERDAWACGMLLYTLLTGVVQDTPAVVEMVGGRRRLKFPPAAGPSREARALCEGLLQRDVRARLQVRAVLQHAWFVGESEQQAVAGVERKSRGSGGLWKRLSARKSGNADKEDPASLRNVPSQSSSVTNETTEFESRSGRWEDIVLNEDQKALQQDLPRAVVTESWIST